MEDIPTHILWRIFLLDLAPGFWAACTASASSVGRSAANIGVQPTWRRDTASQSQSGFAIVSCYWCHFSADFATTVFATQRKVAFLHLSLPFSSASPRRSRVIQRVMVFAPISSCLVTWTWIKPTFTTPTARWRVYEACLFTKGRTGPARLDYLRETAPAAALVPGSGHWVGQVTGQHAAVPSGQILVT